MQLSEFDTRVVPAQVRLDTFRAAATEFDIAAVGDPRAFASRWRMLVLGDLNLIHTQTSPLHYRRDAARIAADGEDRITVHYYIEGGEAGTIDGRPVEIGSGEAMIWDLAVPFDLQATGSIDSVIMTLPRYLIEEVLPTPSLAGPLAASPELALVIEQALYLLDNATAVPDAAATFYGRALRDMLAVAMLPSYRSVRPMDQPDAPLLQRMTDLIDARLPGELSVGEIAIMLDVAAGDVGAVAAHFGGLSLLSERRRLLRAYRLLCDPRETDTVSAIAHRCGFPSETQFSRRFRSIFRTSASDLRRYGRARLPGWAGGYPVEQLYGALIAR